MDWIIPMEPILNSELKTGNEWIHQIKWDGIRGLIYIDNGDLRLFTKKGKERTKFYPELQQLKELVNAKQVILDGEIIIVDQNLKPSFELVLTRERLKNIDKLNYYIQKYPIQYVIFDILAYNGELLTNQPLWRRKEILSEIVVQNEKIAITNDFKDSKKLFEVMIEKKWEGIVSKNINSLYLSGKKHNEWFKNKINKKMLTVVGGIQWKQSTPNSLLLGVYYQKQLSFIGKASIGLKQSDFIILKENSKHLIQEDSPFVNIKKMPDVTWLKPALTCWVKFLEFTGDKQLRHPQIIGFSTQNHQEAIGKEMQYNGNDYD